ncbi:TonB family protein [Pseudidiomarina homiensis]|uniref:TonB family protein n=1 Tax=Pseudidiomarina homiensis TaxID=364198 RepID=UPI00215B3E2E|nr:TonB family protein [Pseudidiomarina homiensis]
MIEWLSEASVVLAVVGALRLVGHRWLLQKLGAVSLYSLWAVVPILLLAVLLPHNWWPLADAISSLRFVIDVQQQFENLAVPAPTNVLSIIWVAGFVLALGAFLLRWPRVNQYWRCGNLRIVRIASGGSPAIAGVLRPTLFLPADFSQRFDAQQRRLILKHEQHHWRRGDTVANIVAFILCMIFWFHPVAWLCYRRFRCDQELACDAVILAQVSPSQRVRYGHTLLQVAATTSTRVQLDPYLYHYGAKQAMKERIQQLSSTQPLRYWPLLSALALGLALLSVWQAPVLAEVKSDAQASPIIRVSPSYPIEAAEQGIEGQVTLRFTITDDGKVADIEVVDAKPAGTFDTAAVAALQKWRYDPSFAGTGHEVALAFQLAKD